MSQERDNSFEGKVEGIESATALFDQLRKQQSPFGANQQEGQYEAASEAEVESDETLIHNEVDATAIEHASMAPEARRALVSLLRQGVILVDQKPKLFESLCRYQSAVRNHLADVYLQLVLDEKAGVAFVAARNGQGDSTEEGAEEDESVSLINRRTLSLYDTLLLLVLRKHYQEREVSGEQRIVIDMERVESNLMPFLPLTNSTKSDRKKLNAALQKMVAKRILSSVRGSDDRFEITPVIRYVVSAEFLERMLGEYQRLAVSQGVGNE